MSADAAQPAPLPPALHKRKGLLERMWRARLSYLLLLPTFALLATFNYYPAARGLLYAFQDVRPGIGSRWVGMDNFGRMLDDRILLGSFVVMAVFVAATLAKSIIAPMAVAVLISRLRSTRLQYFFQTAFLAPIVVPGMVGILLWRGFILDPNSGLINETLALFGILGPAWLGEHSTALMAIILVGFPWVGGIGFLIFLAGLLGIPSSLLESARLDGAGSWRVFWHIELPLIIGPLKLVMILTFIGSIQDFAGILVLTGGGPGTATLVPALHMYNSAFRFDQFGYGAAIGFVLFLLILGLTILNLTLLKSRRD